MSELVGVSRWICSSVVGLVVLCAVGGANVCAQDTPAAGPSGSSRERELRDQLKTILKELDEIQQQKESEKPETERTSIIKEQVANIIGHYKRRYVFSGTALRSRRYEHRQQAAAKATRRNLAVCDCAGGDRFAADQNHAGVTSVATRHRATSGERPARLQHHDPRAGREDHLCGSRYQNLRRRIQPDAIRRIVAPRHAGSLVHAEHEVIRGASSSLYDNYALGGMVHFRTRRGSDINGFETFLSEGRLDTLSRPSPSASNIGAS